MASHDVALQIMQEALLILDRWSRENSPPKFQVCAEDKAVKRAKEILLWTNDKKLDCLRLLFDRIKVSAGQTAENYHPVGAIADTDPYIPYPSTQKPDLTEYKKLVKAELEKLQAEDWQNLSLLTLFIEKYGSCLSFGESDIALIDMARSTAAVAAALADNPEAQQMALIAGDLSGIQNFIYTISSEGALKSLRARSFYLELVTEEILQQFLERLQLPRTSIIYYGGGKFYLISPAKEQLKKYIADIAAQFNAWLSHEFQNKIFLATGYQTFEIDKVKDNSFVEAAWNPIITLLNEQKNRKFNDQLSKLLNQRYSYEPCKICHRDDQKRLARLDNHKVDSVIACFTCCRMFQLGEQIFKAKVIVRSRKRWLSFKRIRMKTPFGAVYYNLYSENDKLPELEATEQIFWINNWIVENYRQQNTFPLLLGNYGKTSEETLADLGMKSGFMRAGEFAQKAAKTGAIARVGYLRMDVDRLGQIFAKGLGCRYSLPKLAGLSRQMSYFFKVYLNSLAEKRKKNFLEYKDIFNFKSLTDGDRPNLLFIYAGGDDLFVSGAWNEIVEFAFDIYQSFRAYTGYNPDITLSGGISIDDIKFPLYQSAESSGKAEDLAKGNGRDSLGLFRTVFKWKQWLGATEFQTVQELINDLHEPNDKVKNPLDIKDKPDWLGILPFVRSLYTELKGDYTRSFVRNLLITAELQEQAIKEKQKQIDELRKKEQDIEDNPKIKKLEDEREEIHYYLHLPKIAYTLARLPDRLRKEDSSFKPVRTSLKSPYNAPYFRAIATWIELLTRNK
ncbi:type III-A CRISPR-associated protein Cas10/Csm1 [[Phormidium ambiguum] IAM M-71]|uniref:CRISPR system single-strand-specific deoxyribonuclease Cas10/Csm1 (subtype III-A) n=1 Tax=[Phormidium ambiguum] IAM M-71 TaxID=454136 RepID=A0A1U7IF84_9CYAN|nr:type III-A CRISPR-associated protein Cas10/Csm1 [Phormidium ambiguum]OKH35672.1 type III-A CRISPR-associated protein Cas10/Csm1 [Phormidium ambiguum IAM M-71]